MQWVTTITVIVAVAISAGPLGTHALRDGAPTDACMSLTPGHPASQASDVPGGYFIDTELRDENFVYNTSEQDSYDGTLYCKCYKCVVVRHYPYNYTLYSNTSFHGVAVSWVFDPNAFTR